MFQVNKRFFQKVASLQECKIKLKILLIKISRHGDKVDFNQCNIYFIISRKKRNKKSGFR